MRFVGDDGDHLGRDLDEAGARSVAEDIERAGGRAIGAQVDVGDVHACGRLVAETVAEFGLGYFARFDIH